MKVTHDEICLARRAPLGEYLMAKYPNEFHGMGESVVSDRDKGFSVHWDVPGYHNFATGESGNPIDYLVRHRGFSFTAAVQELCEFRQFPLPMKESRPFQLPYPGLKNDSVVRYLSCRGIPTETILELIRKKVLYQDERNNAVFVNAERTYCEIRGTGRAPFYGCRKASGVSFWHIPCAPNPDTAYVCEGAIDAVSLMLLRQPTGVENAVYVSIGGPGNQRALNRIKERIHTVLAVDNDEEGDKCRKRNPELKFLLPAHKDWNEDLLDSRDAP